MRPRFFPLLVLIIALFVLLIGLIYSASIGSSETAFLETGEQITIHRDAGKAAEKIKLDDSFNYLVNLHPKDFDFFNENIVPYYLGKSLSDIKDEEELYCTVYYAIREHSLVRLVDFEDRSREIPYSIYRKGGSKTEEEGTTIPLHCVLDFHGVEKGHSYLAIYKIPDFSKVKKFQRPKKSEEKYWAAHWIVASDSILSFGEFKPLEEWA